MKLEFSHIPVDFFDFGEGSEFLRSLEIDGVTCFNTRYKGGQAEFKTGTIEDILKDIDKRNKKQNRGKRRRKKK